MKLIYRTLVITFSLFLFYCASGYSQQIISNGTAYEVKGKAIYKDGKEITQTLTPKEKKDILNELDKKIKADKRAEKVKKQTEKDQKKAEKEIKKQKVAHKDFERASKKLQDAQNKYNRLKRKGKLLPNEEEKLLKRIEDLKKDVAKYNKRI